MPIMNKVCATKTCLLKSFKLLLSYQKKNWQADPSFGMTQRTLQYDNNKDL